LKLKMENRESQRWLKAPASKRRKQRFNIEVFNTSC
jgi:hypothetical protein